jgi:uncharacterized protein YbbC (DUF1343 family)
MLTAAHDDSPPRTGQRMRAYRSRQSWRTVLLLAGAPLVATGACQPADGASDAADRPEPGAAVRVGAEVLLADSLHLVRGRRAGLVTNHTGRTAAGTTIDLLHRHGDVQLVALFAPEHGIRGDAEAGEIIDDGVDDRTGLPVHSLYGGSRAPDAEHLAGLDVLLFDIQDVGARYYTYVWTMALAMEAAGDAGIPFVVLDRPNPIGGVAQGNVLDPAFSTFVGLHPVPMRHGLTPGEMARLVRGEFGVAVELHVVPLQGWRPAMSFAETGLEWIPPSPNIPSVESALHYPGTCLFEGTNLSVGRGTDRAFQQVGAPWLDGEALAAAMTARIETGELAGVRFEAVRFTPQNPGDGKFPGQEVGGVRLVVTDADVYDPARAGVALVAEALRLSGDAWEWNVSHFDRLAGTDALRLNVSAETRLDRLTGEWENERAAFEAARERVLIYR